MPAPLPNPLTITYNLEPEIENQKSKMAALIIVLYIVFALVTVALVSLDAHATEDRALSMAEIVFVLFFWPYFLIATIIHLNTPD